MKFLLTKYYMDCVTAGEEVALCYASDLTVGGVRLKQSSVLLHEGGKITENRQSFFRGVLPQAVDSQWVWDCPALNTHGAWAFRNAPAQDICLYESADGKTVFWQCLTPKTEAKLNVKGKTLNGQGYAECLRMSLEPWKMPLNVLHWGRFHPIEGEALTWIIWEGAHPLSLLMLGTQSVPTPVPNAARDGSHIDFNNGYALEFSRKNVLRTGDIGQTALRRLPDVVKKFLPSSILHLKETKWAGPATLNRHGEIIPGFTIHEVVNFLPNSTI